MATKTLDFNTLTAANPYVIGSAPDNLTGYALATGSGSVKIFNTGTKELALASGTRAIFYDATNMTGVTIRSTIKMGNVNSNNRGGGVCDAAGNGYIFITNNVANNFRIYKVVGTIPTTLIYTSPTLTPVVNNNYTLERNTTTGVIKLLDNAGTQIGVDSPADLTYPNARFACCYSEYGYLRGLTSEYTPAQTVTSINGGAPITSSQSAVAAITTGFTGLPTTITTNATGVTCGTISGTTNAPTWVQTVRTDGAVFPKSGTVVTYTFTNGAETANGDQTINKDADQTAVIVASPINEDTTCLFGAIFAAMGRSAASGDEVYHTVPAGMSDLVVNPDGTMEVTNAGTFACWIWTISTGVNYYYSVTITENGVVIGGGLTSSGLTSSGLTIAGLISPGL